MGDGLFLDVGDHDLLNDEEDGGSVLVAVLVRVLALLVALLVVVFVHDEDLLDLLCDRDIVVLYDLLDLDLRDLDNVVVVIVVAVLAIVFLVGPLFIVAPLLEHVVQKICFGKGWDR